MVMGPSKHVLRVKLDSGASILVASDLDKAEAERRELAIHQIMIEFRTKRNAWEQEPQTAQVVESKTPR